jgi:hypothetical protein
MPLAALIGAAPASAVQPQASPQQTLALLALQQAQLTVADGGAADEFGYSVALSGDTALVGAPNHDVGASGNQGAAYVFVRSGTTWAFQQKLTVGEAGDLFGFSVALSGDTALIGAPHHTVGINHAQGLAYVYVRTDASWAFQRQLMADDGLADDMFGLSVALSGDTALVGAPLVDVGGNANQGAAYVSARADTTWSTPQRLPAVAGAAGGDQFGWSVALSGETALVGAPYDDIGATADQGSVYEFGRSGTTWSQQGWQTVPGVGGGDQFGYAVALSGATSVAGARADDFGANNDQGSAYVFLLDGVAPVTSATLAPAANAAGWCKAPVTVTLSAGDDLTGVAASEYRLTGAAAWTPYAAPFVVSTQGSSIYEYRSTDAAGNAEAAKSLTVNLDSTKPTTKAYAAKVKKGKKVKLAYKVADAQPGCGQAAVTLKIYKGKKLKKTLKVGSCACNAKTKYSWRCRLAKGKYTLKVYASDLAGNAQSKVGSARLTVK